MKKKKSREISLLEVRKQLGWSQKEMALMLKISPGHCSNLEVRRQAIPEYLLHSIHVLQSLLAQTDVPAQSNFSPALQEKDLLKLRAHRLSLEVQIAGLNKRRQKSGSIDPEKFQETYKMQVQCDLLENSPAPLAMKKTLRAILGQRKKRLSKQSPADLYLLEAKWMGKQAECRFLDELLKKL